jgi:hypothetical protein
VKVKGMQLGFTACDLELLAFPHPELVLTARRQMAEKTWYHCPLVSFIIDHPDGLILWETGAAPTAAEEWPEEWQELRGRRSDDHRPRGRVPPRHPDRGRG